MLPVVALVISLAAAALPMLAWAYLVWLCDRFEREPLPLLFLSFLWGALPAVALALAAELLLTAAGGQRGPGLHLLAASGVTPIAEEFAKGAGLLLLLAVRRREIDGVVDGIVYGAMVGFGFAVTENFLYFLAALAGGGWDTWRFTVILRSTLFGLNHAFFTALFGAGVGYARSAGVGKGRWLAPVLGLGAALAAHAAHNLGTELSAVIPAGLLLSLASDSGGLLLVVGLLSLASHRERQWLRAGLASEVGGLVSAEEYELLSSLRGRRRMLARARRGGGWAGLRAAGRFQQAASELAFRRWRDAALGRAPEGDARLQQLLATMEQSHRELHAAWRGSD